MAEIIGKNNILFTKRCFIDEMNQRFFVGKAFKLTDCCRIFASGKLKAISGYPCFSEHYYLNTLKSQDDFSSDCSFLETPDHSCQYQIVLPNQLNQHVSELLSQHQLQHLLTTSFRHPDHIDLVTFMHQGQLSQAIDDYLNHIDYLEQFSKLFLSEAHTLLCKDDSDLITLSPAVTEFFQQAFQRNHTRQIDASTNIAWQQWSQHHQITARERDCFKLLLRGFNTKQIAQKLSISPRTVESHTMNLRKKTQSASRSQLIDKFNYLIELD